MIKIQKEDFNSEEEINKIKNIHANVGAVDGSGPARAATGIRPGRRLP